MILVNGNKVEIEYYPNKESKVKEFEVDPINNRVELFYEDDRDLIHLMFAKSHIDETGAWMNTLIIHYMPYSRMDRKIEGDLFTLKYICKFISDLGFLKIIIVDPHSNVFKSFLQIAQPIYPILDWLPMIIRKIEFDVNNDCIIIPDEGAREKFGQIGLSIYAYPFRFFDKKRCEITGKLLDMEFLGTLPEGCKKCIIIDDICSKGGTFAWAASILQKMGVEDITLATTHCEDTIFDGNLLEGNLINRIYTSNSMIRNKEHEKIHVLPIKFY